MTEAARRAGQIADAMLAKDEFSRWLGIELLQVRPSWCMCRMSVRPEMVNGFGVAHGGIVFSLEESATNRLGFFRVRVTNQRDDIVALFRGTVYKTSQEHP
jgi:acyl-coenzyme A thioesterase PaaI-like protein